MQFDKLDICYLRLSREDGDLDEYDKGESNSISSQRKCIYDFVNRNIDITNDLEEFVDDGYSGTNFERPAMKKLLKLVEAGKIRTILVKDLSRFGRNYLEVGFYLEYVFPMYKVRIISVNDNFDSKKLGEKTGGIEIAIRNLINEQYSRDISKKIKSVVDGKKMQGQFVYGTAPFGYQKGEVKNTIVVDAVAAKTVKYIFYLASHEFTISKIAAKLNEEKITTPSVYLANIRGKYKTRNFWTYESVRNIIQNRIYTGDTEPFKSHVIKVGSNRVKQIPMEERVVIENTHEAIITREEFFSARQIVKKKVKTKGSTKKSILSTYLVCGCCGNKLTKGRSTNKTFKCSSARYVSEAECKYVNCNEDKMIDIIYHAIQMQMKLADAKIRELEISKEQGKSEILQIQKKMKHLKQQIESSKERKMQFYEEYVTGKLTKEEFLAKKAEEIETEDASRYQLKVLEQRKDDLKTQQEKSEQVAQDDKQFQNYKNCDTLNEEMLKEFIDKVIIMPDGTINIVWNFRNELEAVI